MRFVYYGGWVTWGRRGGCGGDFLGELVYYIIATTWMMVRGNGFGIWRKSCPLCQNTVGYSVIDVLMDKK
jgi:hypothetical protein